MGCSLGNSFTQLLSPLRLPRGHVLVCRLALAIRFFRLAASRSASLSAVYPKVSLEVVAVTLPELQTFCCCILSYVHPGTGGAMGATDAAVLCDSSYQ